MRLALRPDVLGGQGFDRLDARERAHERRAGAVEERPAGFADAADDGVEVVVVLGVDDDPPARLAEPLGGTAAADLVEREARDRDVAALLAHEVEQVRRAVAERGVAGELGLPHRHVAGPVDVVAREAPGLEERGDEQDGVVAAADDGAPRAVDRLDLGADVAAQRRVAAADDLQVRVLLEQPARDALGQLRRLGLRERARVGEEERRLGVERERGVVEREHDRDAVDGLGAGGVVIENGDHAVLDTRLSRCQTTRPWRTVFSVTARASTNCRR